MRNRITIIVLFVFLLYCGAYAESPEYSATLDGLHKFEPADNPSYSSTRYDDSQWQSIKVPGSWQSQRIRPEKDIGWYRIHFFAPAGLRKLMPAVLLGRIGERR